MSRQTQIPALEENQQYKKKTAISIEEPIPNRIKRANGELRKTQMSCVSSEI